MLISEFKRLEQRAAQLRTQDGELNSQQDKLALERDTLAGRYGYGLSINYLYLATHVHTRLQQAGYTTVEQVVRAVIGAVPGTIPIPGFGAKSWEALVRCVTENRYTVATPQELEESLHRIRILEQQEKIIEGQRVVVQQERASLAALTGHNTPLSHLGLSSRTYSRLHGVGYETVGEIIGALITSGPSAVMDIRQFGKTSWQDLLGCIENTGYMPEDLRPALNEEFTAEYGG